MKQASHTIAKRDAEQGFALYMAIGFIVLISALAGTVGNRLNTTIVLELRNIEGNKVLVEAETALSQGWEFVFDKEDNDPNWFASAVGDSSAQAITDRDNCLATRDTNYADFYVASQVTNSDIRRRYFVRKSGSDYTLVGCGFSDADTRAALAVLNASGGTFSLTRQRRY